MCFYLYKIKRGKRKLNEYKFKGRSLFFLVVIDQSCCKQITTRDELPRRMENLLRNSHSPHLLKRHIAVVFRPCLTSANYSYTREKNIHARVHNAHMYVYVHVHMYSDRRGLSRLTFGPCPVVRKQKILWMNSKDRSHNTHTPFPFTVSPCLLLRSPRRFLSLFLGITSYCYGCTKIYRMRSERADSRNSRKLRSAICVVYFNFNFLDDLKQI